MDNRLDARLQEIRRTFDTEAKGRGRSKRLNWYYYKKLTDYYRFFIPEGYRVLEVGSGDGELLHALKPRQGVGIDASPVYVERASGKYPHLSFRQGFAENFKIEQKFDYIVLSDLVGYLDDVQLVFQNLRAHCAPSTRLVIQYYNYLWEPMLRLGSFLGLRMRQKVQNWLSLQDLENLLKLSGFETVKKTRKVLFPYYVPLLSGFMNRFIANLPLIRKFCLMDFIVASPLAVPRESPPGVSVVVACRNEKGNIDELVRRLPRFPGESELIFVDGNSTDGTREEINRMAQKHPEKNIRLIDQKDSTGKGKAVRLGFEAARQEVLIILDADLSVAPEDTVKFYECLVSGKGELINGTRMVYPMEKEAMRFLNILGNKFFSMVFTYLLDQKIRDTLCGTKVLYKKDYEKIAANRKFFGDFDPFGDFDLLFGAAKLNLKILELPVRYYERRYGSTKIDRFRHGFLLLRMSGIALRRLKFI